MRFPVKFQVFKSIYMREKCLIICNVNGHTAENTLVLITKVKHHCARSGLERVSNLGTPHAADFSFMNFIIGDVIVDTTVLRRWRQRDLGYYIVDGLKSARLITLSWPSPCDDLYLYMVSMILNLPCKVLGAYFLTSFPCWPWPLLVIVSLVLNLPGKVRGPSLTLLLITFYMLMVSSSIERQ